MSWQSAFIHFGNFLILPLFVGGCVGVIARALYFNDCSYRLLAIAGFFGCLTGLIVGWIVTGQDGHMLNYALALLICVGFILITAGIPKKTNASKNKSRK